MPHARFCTQNADEERRRARRDIFYLPTSQPQRSVNPMNAFFNSIRRIKFRRGPQRLAGGIASGLAELLGANVWLVRLLVLISFLLPVVGVLLYIIVWILTPWQDESIPLERVLTNRPGTR